jgi:hypothetical protein
MSTGVPLEQHRVPETQIVNFIVVTQSVGNDVCDFEGEPTVCQFNVKFAKEVTAVGTALSRV